MVKFKNNNFMKQMGSPASQKIKSDLNNQLVKNELHKSQFKPISVAKENTKKENNIYGQTGSSPCLPNENAVVMIHRAYESSEGQNTMDEGIESEADDFNFD
jgi:hypothetical protein